MFNRIKDKFKNILKRSEEVIEGENFENLEKISEIRDEEISGKENNKNDLENNLGNYDIDSGSSQIDGRGDVDLNSNDEDDNEEKKDKEDKKNSFFSGTFKKLTTKKIDEKDFEKIWNEIEFFLLDINIAYDICESLKEKLREKIVGNKFNRFMLRSAIKNTLIEEVKELLKEREEDLIELIKGSDKPFKILIIGINGTGKTTTIAKLIYKLKKENLSSVVAASDTFRAAAIEQLEEHSNKLGFKLIKHSKGSDPTAVAFDTLKHAESKNVDVVLIDTAGRMANNKNLMEELKKTKRVIKPDLILFIGDSNSGNDLIDQIKLFNTELNIDGIILTKVDTDEKPGSIVTTAYVLDKPIYFLGTGQNYDDLVTFNAEEIAKSLFE